MKHVLLLLVLVLALPSAAQAHQACLDVHGARFCKATSYRHTIRALRQKERPEAQRAGIVFHRRQIRTWKLGALWRADRWERHMLEHYRQLPTHVAILHPEDWRCLSRYESGGNWAIRGGTYWGGLQMDSSFMHTYGGDMIARHDGGLANTWTEYEQMLVAQRAWEVRGYQPWPQTSIMCGLR